MGNGIAHVFSLYDNNVILVDINDNIINQALTLIQNNMKRQCNKEVITKQRMKQSYNNIIENYQFESLNNCTTSKLAILF